MPQHDPQTTSPYAELVERYERSEFALLEQAAGDAGLPWQHQDVERFSLGSLSAIRWGTGPIDLVFLHGGGQNARTWDTVVLALRHSNPALTALAIDLPGHGHSARRADRDYSPVTIAETIAPILDSVAPNPKVVVGMSLGGLTAIALDAHPWPQSRRVLVDVTPSSGERFEQMAEDEKGLATVMAGPRDFDSLDSVVASVADPPYTVTSSLVRGILNNTIRTADGTWSWRYDILDQPMHLERLWPIVGQSGVPTLLVRGGDSSFTSDADVAEFKRRDHTLRVDTIAGAGHSVQSSRPVELASSILRWMTRA